MSTTPAPNTSSLATAIEVMDTLRSENGCPWDAQQTHGSLVKYLLEESHELAEAIEHNDRANMREELGDVLLQVLFHTRIAQEHPTDPFSINDVAQDLADKLKYRHPHVFGDVAVKNAQEVNANWERLKREEKQRDSILDGIPLAQGALARTQKVISRAQRNELFVNALESVSENVDNKSNDEKIGFELFELVQRAASLGVDAEGALRQILQRVESKVRHVETAHAEQN